MQLFFEGEKRTIAEQNEAFDTRDDGGCEISDLIVQIGKDVVVVTEVFDAEARTYPDRAPAEIAVQWGRLKT